MLQFVSFFVADNFRFVFIGVRVDVGRDLFCEGEAKEVEEVHGDVFSEHAQVLIPYQLDGAWEPGLEIKRSLNKKTNITKIIINNLRKV